MAYVNSTAISKVEYNASTQMLFVTFVGGKSYTYYSVPAWKYAELMSASSKGTYFNERIRDQHSTVR
jgi:hypothetical protein